MNIYEKMEANNLIEALSEDGTTFDAGKAKRLIEIVPALSVMAPFNHGSPRRDKKSSFGGYTPEFGTVVIEGDDGRPKPPEPERVGGYRVRHVPGLMIVGNENSDNLLIAKTGDMFLLKYNAVAQKPETMLLYSVEVKKIWGILPTKVASWAQWKTPSGG